MHFATLNQHRANYCGDIGKNHKKPTIFGWFFVLRFAHATGFETATCNYFGSLGKLDDVVNYTDMKYIY
jgi:hypothetical protein